MDTEGNFRPERIEAIAERFGLDANETLENIIVTRVFNHEQQIERAHVREGAPPRPSSRPLDPANLDYFFGLRRAYCRPVVSRAASEAGAPGLQFIGGICGGGSLFPTPGIAQYHV